VTPKTINLFQSIDYYGIKCMTTILRKGVITIIRNTSYLSRKSGFKVGKPSISRNIRFLVQLVQLVYVMLYNACFWYRLISGVMVSVFSWRAVGHGFEPRSSQTKDYTIDICRLSAKHTSLRSESTNRLAQNIVSVSQHSTHSTKCVGLVQSGHHHHLI
jgi:hypothetical protein